MNKKSKDKSENNYAFIDAQNLHNGVKREQNWKIDYARFRILLRDKYKVKKSLLIHRIHSRKPRPIYIFTTVWVYMCVQTNTTNYR